MKCTECPDYKACSRQNDLRRKRHKCKKAHEPFAQTNADRIRSMSDEGMAKYLAAMFVEQRVLDAVESGKDLSYVSCRVLEAAFYSMLLQHLKQPAKERNRAREGEDDGTAQV